MGLFQTKYLVDGPLEPAHLPNHCPEKNPENLSLRILKINLVNQQLDVGHIEADSFVDQLVADRLQVLHQHHLKRSKVK